tara:strand:+ start:91 stop:246 length:156 start_codon:yes stop_codon:yes gene_type:complete
MSWTEFELNNSKQEQTKIALLERIASSLEEIADLLKEQSNKSENKKQILTD